MRTITMLSSAHDVETRFISFDRVKEICKETDTDLTPEQIINELGRHNADKLEELKEMYGAAEYVRMRIEARVFLSKRCIEEYQASEAKAV